MTNEEKYEEAKLINLLANDSEYAFQLLYDRHRNRIYRLSTKFLKSPILAQEVVQDVFLKLWMTRKEINANKPLEAWLFTVAKNTLINRFKKLSKEWNELTIYTKKAEVIEENTDSKILTNEIKLHLNDAINQLPEKQKEVYQLAKNEGYSYNEIAVKMQISPLTVKTHLTRALESIRAFLIKRGIS
jgi:RNA polymerase sigma-70 factor (ECF subfamily)